MLNNLDQINKQTRQQTLLSQSLLYTSSQICSEFKPIMTASFIFMKI